MSDHIDNLVEMGFSRARVELAVSRTGSNNVEQLTEWLITHEDEPEPIVNLIDPEPAADQTQAPTADQPAADGQVVKSIKCEDCGKLFKSQDEVEYHATKSGHSNFSESTEEKKPLTEDEKKEQLAKIETKLRERRLQREAREKQEALEKERNRIKSGKEMLEAKKKHEELEMKKIVEQRKREKEEEKMARQRVKEQIEQDKLARKAKFSGAQPMETQSIPPEASIQQLPKAPSVSCTEIVLQIKLTDGAALTHKFGAKEPLSAVKLYVEMNRKDEAGPFNLMTAHPKKVFGPEDYDVPLETLGLGPRALLFVSKT